MLRVAIFLIAGSGAIGCGDVSKDDGSHSTGGDDAGAVGGESAGGSGGDAAISGGDGAAESSGGGTAGASTPVGGTSSGGTPTGGTPVGGESTGGATGGLGGDKTGRSCLYDGVIYPDGSGFTMKDGCNNCGCVDGMTQCTALACSNGCSWSMGLGADYYEADGCVYCVCGLDGTDVGVSCVDMSPCVTCTDEGTTYYPGDAWTKTCATCNCKDTLVDGTTVGEVVCLETC